MTHRMAAGHPGGVADGAQPEHLQPGRFVDSDHPDVIAFSREHAGDGSPRERAVRLYYAVRDRFRYDPYGIQFTEEGMKASAVLRRGTGFCVTKAALLAACCRVQGTPARLGFADVRNHLASEKLLRLMGTDLFVYHGFTELYLSGRWVKATPAFNLSLCEAFKVLPLEFDGRTDSLLHPFDATGRRHMEYVRERGSRDDVPVEELRAEFARVYPALFASTWSGAVEGDLEREAIEGDGGG